MRFKEIYLRNFRSWKELDFKLDNRGLVFLSGLKGAGKSSIFDAVSYALYGYTLRGLGGDDIVNWVSGKDCEVKLTMEVNETEYILRCFRKIVGKAGIEIYVDGKLLPIQTIPEAKKELQKVIPFGFECFKNSIIFGQSVDKYFSGYTDADQKEIFESILGIDMFDVAEEKAKIFLKGKDGDVKVVEAELVHIEGIYNELVEEYQILKEELREESLKKKESTKLLEKTLDGLENKASGISNEIDELVEKLDKHKIYLDMIDGKKKKLKWERTALGEKINKYCDPLWDICHECGQKITEDYKDEKVNELREQCDEMDKVIADFDKERTKIDGIMTKTEDRHEKLSDELDKLDKKILEINNEIAIASASSESIIEEKNKKIEQLEAKLMKLKKEIKDKKESLGKDKDMKAKASFAAGAFGKYGIRVLYLEKFLPFFNNRINKYLKVLDEPELVFSMSEMAKMICEFKEGKRTYKKASGGERRCQDLAVGCALLDLAVKRIGQKPNILILDEPFDGLDDYSKEKAVELFNTLKVESIFVMSHNDALASLFPKVIRIIKEPNDMTGFSRMEV